MRLILAVLIFSFMVNAKESPMKFLREQALQNQKKFKYNRYESIISGGLAFIVGNIGYYGTDSSTLKVAYSGIQTIGILNVGQGIYDYYRPVFDTELYLALREPKTAPKRIIKVFAQEEKAKRLSLLYKSSLLATQYFANAFLGDTDDSLKDVYTFLGGVNLIVVGYATFYKDKYEEYYYSNYLTPSVFRMKDSFVAGLSYTKSF
ncbi:MAG: hypothetical protein KC478_01445 [Bacteriovoracaceae bacterium]|nr:hypothetical protein [Bacteriovoracaceae bacterium]